MARKTKTYRLLDSRTGEVLGCATAEQIAACRMSPEGHVAIERYTGAVVGVAQSYELRRVYVDAV